MDNLTHGLLGASIAALRRSPAGAPREAPSSAQRATLLCCVLAAELPDLDALLPAANDVVHALQAHRGLSHAVAFAPVWAAAATGITRLFFRSERAGPLFAFSLMSVLFAHLAADAWTGWGTRLLLPFSDARVTWDWMLVVDPIFTAPLLLAALVAAIRRRWWRPALLIGFAAACGYLGTRVVLRSLLVDRVASAYPRAERVAVFPGWMGISRWRYVVAQEDHLIAGEIAVRGAPREQARRPAAAAVSEAHARSPTVAAAVAWARFPLVQTDAAQDGGATVRVADLRYHVGGAPTLAFVIHLGPDGSVTAASLDRGGTAADLLARWRAAAPR